MSRTFTFRLSEGQTESVLGALMAQSGASSALRAALHPVISKMLDQIEEQDQPRVIPGWKWEATQQWWSARIQRWWLTRPARIQPGVPRRWYHAWTVAGERAG